MKSLVLFDTTFGNTRIIANAISSELGKDASAIRVNDFKKSHLRDVQLLIVGSPIIAWKPAERMGQFLAVLSNDQLRGIRAAAFDTRVKLFIHGDAATKITESLKAAGADIVTASEFFYVRGKEGPLYKGEIESFSLGEAD